VALAVPSAGNPVVSLVDSPGTPMPNQGFSLKGHKSDDWLLNSKVAAL